MIRWLCIAATLIVSGCSSSGDEPTGLDTALELVQSNADSATPRFQALRGAARPIMQIGLIDAGTGGNMLLEARNGPYEHYLSPNAASMVFSDGLLHQIIGFGEALMAVEVSETKALLLSGRSGTADRTHTYLTGDDRSVFRSYRCVITNAGPASINLPHRSAQTTLMRETCRNAEQAFENLYWVEPARGQIVQSRQWAGPNLGAVSTRRAGLSG